jgi:Flp pilus assembly protein TadG
VLRGSGFVRVGPFRQLRTQQDESGQIIVFVTLLLVVVIGGAGLAIDLGSNDAAQRRLQQVAEAAALAAARALPSAGDTGPAGTCTITPADPAGAAACDAVTTNLTSTDLSNVNVIWTPNFRGNANEFEVAVSADNPDFFARVFGINSTTITQRAAATNAAVGGSQGLLYANDPVCGLTRGIYTVSPANSMHLTGAVESAGSVTLNSNGNTSVQGATYGGPNNCPYTGTVTFTGPNEPVQSPTAKTWPATWNSPLSCDFVGVSFTLSSASLPGIYCASGNISVGNNTSGTFTLQAQSFTFGQHLTLSPAPDAPAANEEPSLKLLLWQTGPGAFDDGNNSSFSGGLWIPNATATVNGNSGITGFLEAQDIAISGNSFAATGTGPLLPGGGMTIAVSE